jgi:hypothetical protein
MLNCGILVGFCHIYCTVVDGKDGERKGEDKEKKRGWTRRRKSRARRRKGRARRRKRDGLEEGKDYTQGNGKGEGYEGERGRMIERRIEGK